MKYALITGLAIVIFSLPVYASDRCSEILSHPIELAIHDLAALQVDLALKIANGESNFFVTVLKSSFEKKYAEILERVQGTITEKEFAQKLTSKIQEIQSKVMVQQQIAKQLEVEQAAVTKKSQIFFKPRRKASFLQASNGSIYIVGGSSSSKQTDLVEEIEVLNPLTNEVKSAGKLMEPRLSPHLSLLDPHHLLVWGGFLTPKSTYAELIDLKTHQSVAFDMDMKNNLNLGGWHSLGDGRALRFNSEKNIFLFDFNLRQVDLIENSVGLSRQGLSLLSDGAIVTSGGGFASEGETAVYLIDPVQKTSKVVAHLSAPTMSHSQVTLPDDSILVLGGSESSVNPQYKYSKIEKVDLKTGKVFLAGELLYGRSAHNSIVLPDKRVVTVGGFDEKGYVREVEVFDPETGKSEQVGTLLVDREFNGESAVLLYLVSDLEVVIMGGTDPKTREPIPSVEWIILDKK